MPYLEVRRPGAPIPGKGSGVPLPNGMTLPTGPALHDVIAAEVEKALIGGGRGQDMMQGGTAMDILEKSSNPDIAAMRAWLALNGADAKANAEDEWRDPPQDGNEVRRLADIMGNDDQIRAVRESKPTHRAVVNEYLAGGPLTDDEEWAATRPVREGDDSPFTVRYPAGKKTLGDRAIDAARDVPWDEMAETVRGWGDKARDWAGGRVDRVMGQGKAMRETALGALTGGGEELAAYDYNDDVLPGQAPTAAPATAPAPTVPPPAATSSVPAPRAAPRALAGLTPPAKPGQQQEAPLDTALGEPRDSDIMSRIEKLLAADDARATTRAAEDRRKDNAMALLRGGLDMAAAASQPGATALGSLAMGGKGAVTAMGDERDRRVAADKAAYDRRFGQAKLIADVMGAEATRASTREERAARREEARARLEDSRSRSAETARHNRAIEGLTADQRETQRANQQRQTDAEARKMLADVEERAQLAAFGGEPINRAQEYANIINAFPDSSVVPALKLRIQADEVRQKIMDSDLDDDEKERRLKEVDRRERSSLIGAGI